MQTTIHNTLIPHTKTNIACKTLKHLNLCFKYAAPLELNIVLLAKLHVNISYIIHE